MMAWRLGFASADHFLSSVTCGQLAEWCEAAELGLLEGIEVKKEKTWRVPVLFQSTSLPESISF